MGTRESRPSRIGDCSVSFDQEDFIDPTYETRYSWDDIVTITDDTVPYVVQTGRYRFDMKDGEIITITPTPVEKKMIEKNVCHCGNWAKTGIQWATWVNKKYYGTDDFVKSEVDSLNLQNKSD